MVVGFAECEVLEVDDFESKKGTRCGVIRWFDRTEHDVFRAMVFGDAVDMLRVCQRGDLVDLLFDVVPSRNDGSIQLRLSAVTRSDA